MEFDWAQLISIYGVWLVAGFIALESIGFPLPAEAALMAAAIFSAANPDLDIRMLLATSVLAALIGNAVGFWIGRRFGPGLLLRHGGRVGLTQARIRIGQWLFGRYGGSFVFTARFLPFLRNMAAVLAGANRMPAPRFYLASSAAAAAWVLCYGLASYWLGAAFAHLASPAAIALALATVVIIVAVPTLIVRYEKRLLVKIGDGCGPPA